MRVCQTLPAVPAPTSAPRLARVAGRSEFRCRDAEPPRERGRHRRGHYKLVGGGSALNPANARFPRFDPAGAVRKLDNARDSPLDLRRAGDYTFFGFCCGCPFPGVDLSWVAEGGLPI